MNKPIIMLAGFALIIAAGLIIIKLGNKSTENKVTTTQKSADFVRKPAPLPKITTVKLSKSGFSPNLIHIKTGETVTWSNESGVDASVNSADHPTHKVNSFLNLGIFSSGSSTQTQFLKKGNFEYHNHLIPSQTGTVVVE